MLNPMATSKNNFDAINFLKMLVTVVVGDHGWGSVHWSLCDHFSAFNRISEF
jgi:hypothetical protein